MPTKYQVFVDNLSGFTWCPALGGDTFEEAVEAIKNGHGHSQHWMYYIYILHQERILFWGARTDVYRHVTTVAGAQVNPISIRHKEGMGYALTTWESLRSGTADWLFADKLW
jgi:hypothetical protein